MTLTVAGVLELEVFSRTPWTVYAGHGQLQREVRWVHPNEAPDIARFLRGGEMLLTAGTGIGRTGREQAAYVRGIAAAGAAVLVVELGGRAFATMPGRLTEAAGAAGLPLVGLHGEVPFVEVSAQVHEVLVGERVSQLAGYERLNHALMETLVSGGDYLALIEALSRESGHPAVLETSGHRVLAHAAPSPRSDALVQGWEQHARLPHPAGQEEGCARRPVTIRGERWGWVHLLHGPATLQAPELHGLVRTTDAVAIRVLTAREDGARTSQRESALVNRLLLNDITGEAFVSRALRLGKDLRQRQLVVVWAATSGTSALATALGTRVAVVTDGGDVSIAVAGLDRGTGEQQVTAELAAGATVAGVSRPCAPADLSAAFRQARSAFTVAQVRGQAISFDELGILRLLMPLSQGPELANYVEDELGPLLRHDAGSAHPLLPTLRAFVAAGGNKSQTAQALFVQRRTLYYRLARISQLLGQDVEEPAALQAVTIAVRGLEFLRQPG